MDDKVRCETARRTLIAAGFREDCIYGFPNVKNPFNFHPDAEMCSEKEIKNWEEAKEEWKKGAHDAGGNRSGWYDIVSNEKKVGFMHVLATDWGMGSSVVFINPDTGEITEDLENI